MNKFSKFSNQPVTEPKESVNELSEIDSVKFAILGLMERTLSIKNVGVNYNMITTEIDGKELFIEALMDLLSEKDNNKAIKVLENLKFTSRDNKSIDDKITEIENKNVMLKYLSENNTYVDKMKAFLDKYSKSEDFDDILEKQIIKIDTKEGAMIRANIAHCMLQLENHKYPKNRLRTIVNKFNYRVTQL